MAFGLSLELQGGREQAIEKVERRTAKVCAILELLTS